MMKITEYLMSLKDIEDVRIPNRTAFSLQEMYFLNVPCFLKYYYEDEATDNETSNDSFDSSFESKNIPGANESSHTSKL